MQFIDQMTQSQAIHKETASCGSHGQKRKDHRGDFEGDGIGRGNVAPWQTGYAKGLHSRLHDDLLHVEECGSDSIPSTQRNQPCYPTRTLIKPRSKMEAFQTVKRAEQFIRNERRG